MHELDQCDAEFFETNKVLNKINTQIRGRVCLLLRRALAVFIRIVMLIFLRSKGQLAGVGHIVAASRTACYVFVHKLQ